MTANLTHWHLNWEIEKLFVVSQTYSNKIKSMKETLRSPRLMVLHHSDKTHCWVMTKRAKKINIVKYKYILNGAKETINKAKTQTINWEKYFQHIWQIKDLCLLYTKNSYKQPKSEQRIWVGSFQIANPKPNKHMKRCSASLQVRKVRSRVTIKYHFSPTKLANTKKSGNPCY